MLRGIRRVSFHYLLRNAYNELSNKERYRQHLLPHTRNVSRLSRINHPARMEIARRPRQTGTTASGCTEPSGRTWQRVSKRVPKLKQ